MFDDLNILLKNLTSFILNGDNKAGDEACRPYDVEGTFMDSIDAEVNDDSSNGLKNQISSDGEVGVEPTCRRQEW